jgi:RHS repeat-associated protein
MKQIQARDVATDARYPPANRALVLLPLPTTYGYSTDGYFQTSVTDPLRHISSQTTDPATGLISTSQSIQGGPWTTYTYDRLGRLITKATEGTQPIQQRLSACRAGANCVLKRQFFQSGAPVRTEYVDRLGRVIATGTEGFDYLEVITGVYYNERGVKVAEYPPWRTSGDPGEWNGAALSPYPTWYSSIDALGRPRTKSVLRDANALFRSGSGDPTLVTNYQSSVVGIGLKTDIAVNKAAAEGGTLSMSRTYDRRGKLVETSEHVSTPTARDIRTSYFYDPAGDLTNIRDSAGNTITAAYDNLGRKTSVNDPDQGKWTFTWDGLSRLRTQTDARGILIAHQYDATGRLERRFMKAPSDAAPYLEANWRYDLNNKPGTLGALVGAVDGFRRDYSYDSLLRPWRVTYHVSGGSGWPARDFAVEYGYDHNYSRMKAMGYPSGELVGLDYDRRGNPIGEASLAADGTRSRTPYRHVTAMSERGQITGQTFGNGISETDQYDNSTGMPLKINAVGLADAPPAGCSETDPLIVRTVGYTYDQFLNVAAQAKQFLLRDPSGALEFGSCTPKVVTASESYGYDDLQRLLSSERTWQGINPNPSPSGDTYAYDDLGNITKKSDYGDLYKYGDQVRSTGLAGPHAVLSVSNGGVVKATFAYDSNGNLTKGDNRTITFDNMDRPVQVEMKINGYTTRFRYAPDGQRYLQSTASSTETRNEYYVDKMYERIEGASAPVERTYVGDAVMIVSAGPSRAVRYRHLDRLGSLDAVTNEKANEDPSDAHGYDAFGKPRARDWEPSSDQMQPSVRAYTTERGFTGHEHLDELYLIHMNGRIYDYRLGRFLNVDPIISNPVNSQSINPYSYIGNNPLSGVDPTGYCADPDDSECATPTGSHIRGLPSDSVPFLNISLLGGAAPKNYVEVRNGNEAQPMNVSVRPEAEQGGSSDAGQQSKEQAQERVDAEESRNPGEPKQKLVSVAIGRDRVLRGVHHDEDAAPTKSGPTHRQGQLSVGISLTAGASPGIWLGGYLGGGTSLGITSDGQTFLQFQADAMAGTGFFAGVGLNLGGGVSDEPIPNGVSTSVTSHSEVNAGWAAAAGVSADVAQGSISGAFTPNPKIGAGYGIMAGTGIGTITTITLPPPLVREGFIVTPLGRVWTGAEP